MSKNLESGEELQRIVKEKKTIVLSFWAEWAEPSVKLNELFDQLAEINSNLVFLKVEAEKVAEVAEHFQVSSVPTFLFLKGGKVIHKIEGAFGSQLTEQVAKLSSSVAAAETKRESAAPKNNLNDRLEKLINLGTVTLFMKGSPSSPQCGFSRKIVDILNEQGIKFESFNIFEDEEVRNGLKEYSNWPTYPQLYIAGKLVGGLDIVKELAEEGELKGMVPATTTKTTSAPSNTSAAPKPAADSKELKERIEHLLNSSKVMLFMKGTPETPQCGFSRKIVDLLNGQEVKFNTFNILVDEEIRTGLKEYSNWPTYPQLYVNAKLVGGLDIVKELIEEGEFADLLA
eukprot:TRINITY_DN1314_c0_g1_i1.p1 TRINITY_DN1314_c0_g1~~TRINITY_DN1314_c0_g1_i1.p1  ORF type:complete len:343 (-),score=145.16 TRINITY_DN1314_c0_g1_i1:105-1133(-)